MKRYFFVFMVLAGLSTTAFAQDIAAVQPDSPGERIYIVSGNPNPPTSAPANNFTGDVTVKMLMSAQDDLGLSSGIVNFPAGARTNWHSHPAGQLLIITAGVGRVQQWGGPVIDVKEGDVVWFPANSKHWHGASADRAMSHIAMAKIVNGQSSLWMEKVSDQQYEAKP